MSYFTDDCCYTNGTPFMRDNDNDDDESGKKTEQQFYYSLKNGITITIMTT